MLDILAGRLVSSRARIFVSQLSGSLAASGLAANIHVTGSISISSRTSHLQFFKEASLTSISIFSSVAV